MSPHRVQPESAMPDFVMTIAGEAAPTEDTFGVRNPAKGEVFAQAPECTRQQLDAAFDAAAKAARDWKARDDDSAYVELARRPLGVVAAITPWNFPPTLAFWKIAPALLLAGNTRHRSPRRPRHHDPETSLLTQRGFDGERVPT
jgi:acyl-CoA reductase-like NAD-dependent aldehyde dehydrogenase